MTVYVFGWQELALRIRDGSIATDLSRPLDPQRYWLAYDLGRAPYHLIFRGIPPFVVGALVFHLHYPSPLAALAFLVSVALAVVVSFGFRFLYNSAAFWLLDYPRRRDARARGRRSSSPGCSLPLALLPDWLRDDRARAAVRVDHPDAGRRLARQAPRARARRRRSRCRRSGRSRCSALGRLVLAARRRASWWCRVADAGRRLPAARRRADPLAAAVPRLVRARRRRRVPDLVPRLPGGARDLPQLAAARRLERARGRVPLRHCRRSRSRSPTCSSATSTSSRRRSATATSTSCSCARAARSSR